MTGVLDATRIYAHTSAMTAGHLKSYQILLEKAMVFLQLARKGDLRARDRAQDIVAQVQSGLNLVYPASQQMYEVMGYVWDALEWNDRPYYDRADDLIRQMRDLVVEVQKLRR